MAINKKLIHFNKKTTFNSQKLSANASNTQYQVGGTGTVQTGAPDINYQSIVYIKDSKEIWTHGQFYATAVTWSTITGKPSFATVATSGSYNDLSNKPTIPTSLPTPNSLTFTGATTGTWNGSAAKTVNIPTYSNASTSSAGLMSTSDKSKLNGIASGAEVNQNAFSNVVVGSTTIAADSKTDTLTLTAGSNITLTPNATNDSITISASGSSYSLPLASNSTRGGIKLSSSAQGGTPNGITTTSGRTYAVQVNSSEQAVVNVPWTDTTYTLPTASASTLGGVKVGSGLSISNGVLSTSGGDVKIHETTINFEDIITNNRTEMTSSEKNEVLNISNKLHQGYVIVVPTTTSGMNMVGGAVPVVDNTPSYSFLFCGGTNYIYIVTATLNDSGDTWDIRQISENIIQSGAVRVYCDSSNSIKLESYGAYNTLYGNSGMTSLGKYNANSTVNVGMTRLVSIGTGTSESNRISGLEVGQRDSKSYVAICDKSKDNCYITADGSTGIIEMYNSSNSIRFDNSNSSIGVEGAIGFNGEVVFSNSVESSSSISAAGGFFDTSDARVKANVKEIDASDADKVKLVEFDRTDKEHHGYGVIAQELEKVYPEMVNTDDEGFKSVNYNELAMVKIKYLEDKVARLEALVGRLLAE